MTVVLDIVTHWWSTHAMIDFWLKLQPAVYVMAQDDQLGSATFDAADWQNHFASIGVIQNCRDLFGMCFFHSLKWDSSYYQQLQSQAHLICFCLRRISK